VLRVILVGAGGFVGSILRYLLSGLAERISDRAALPVGTMVVNLSGCFVIGLLAHLAESRGAFPAGLRTFLFIGVLGGYTTFSTFGNESLALLRGGQLPLAALNVVVQVLGGLCMVWAGRTVGQVIWR
jgi:fluoride exporter